MAAIQQLLLAPTPTGGGLTYATWDPANRNAGVTLSNGNLTASRTSGNGGVTATQGKTSGKWYWEVTVTDLGGGPLIGGYGTASDALTTNAGISSTSIGWFNNGAVYRNNTIVASISTYTTGNVLGFAYDADAGTLALYHNGTLQTTLTGVPAGLFPGFSRDGTVAANFGASAFAYSVPSGFNPGVYTSGGASSTQWRINISSTQTGDSFFATIAELQLRGSIGGANLATGGTASASSAASGFAAANAFDSNATTMWTSDTGAPGPQWLQYTFASAVSIQQVAVQSGDSSARALRAPQNFTIEWFNGSTWVVAYTSPTQSAWGISELRTFNL